jgi:hypothetical protein
MLKQASSGKGASSVNVIPTLLRACSMRANIGCPEAFLLTITRFIVLTNCQMFYQNYHAQLMRICLSAKFRASLSRPPRTVGASCRAVVERDRLVSWINSSSNRFCCLEARIGILNTKACSKCVLDSRTLSRIWNVFG